MTYEAVDHEIIAWAERHSLKLFTVWNEHPARFAYVSSEAGECFQISIAPPQDGRTCIHAFCIEGRREDHFPVGWSELTENLAAMLEEVFDIVTAWMRPSVRHFPPPVKPAP